MTSNGEIGYFRGFFRTAKFMDSLSFCHLVKIRNFSKDMQLVRIGKNVDNGCMCPDTPHGNKIILLTGTCKQKESIMGLVIEWR